MLVTGTELLGGRIHDLDIHKMIFCDNFCHIGTGSSTTELSDFVFLVDLYLAPGKYFTRSKNLRDHLVFFFVPVICLVIIRCLTFCAMVPQVCAIPSLLD